MFFHRGGNKESCKPPQALAKHSTSLMKVKDKLSKTSLLHLDLHGSDPTNS